MNEMNTGKSLFIVITAVLAGGIILLCGLDAFLGFPLCFVLWLAVGYGATALAHLIAMLVYLITKKNYLNMLLVLCPGLLTLISIGWAIRESQSFMGSLGAAVIEVLFTIPCGGGIPVLAGCSDPQKAVVSRSCRMRRRYNRITKRTPMQTIGVLI